MRKLEFTTLIVAIILKGQVAFAVSSVHFISVTNKLSQNETSLEKENWQNVDKQIFNLISNVKENTSIDQIETMIGTDEKANSFIEFKNKISANSLKYIFEKSELNQSSIVKTTKSLEKSLQANMEIKDDNAEKNSHKLGFNLDAFKNSANLNYSELLDCTVKYNYNSSVLNVSINEKISEQSSIVISHIKDSAQSQQQISYNVSF